MKIVVTSHGEFCTGLVSSYKMVAGETDEIFAISLNDSGIGEYSKKLTEKLEELLKEDKVLVLCDIKGGTPYNESFKFFLDHTEDIRVVSGMNLPMLIEIGLILQSIDDLNILADMAVNAGKNAIEQIVLDDDQEEDEWDL